MWCVVMLFGPNQKAAHYSSSILAMPRSLRRIESFTTIVWCSYNKNCDPGLAALSIAAILHPHPYHVTNPKGFLYVATLSARIYTPRVRLKRVTHFIHRNVSFHLEIPFKKCVVNFHDRPLCVFRRPLRQTTKWNKDQNKHPCWNDVLTRHRMMWVLNNLVKIPT